MKLDIHLNIGRIPPSTKQRREGVEHYCPVDKVVQFIKGEELTDAVVLFTDREDIIELKKRVDCKIYALYWIESFDVIKDIIWDENCQGICIHSHRGGEKGLDYTKFGPYLKYLPEDSIVCVHTQGTSSYENVSRGNSVAKWASLNPNIKFIIEHSGSYFRTEYYPKVSSYDEYIESDMVKQVLLSACASEVCVKDAITVSEIFPNVYLDTSRIHNKNYKGDLVSKSFKWAFGSDYPFHNGNENPDYPIKTPGTLVTVTRQENIFKKYYEYSEEDIKRVHDLGIQWLNLSCRDLWNDYITIGLQQRGVNV